ncbi:MAG: CHAT domain-containing protein [Thermoanaerobaculia bacterium]|nr:CHAT domain-containing protein [Thermoanaerobaculia bacterium]
MIDRCCRVNFPAFALVWILLASAACAGIPVDKTELDAVPILVAGGDDQVGALSGGEQARFRFEAPDDSYLYLAVSQHGVDLVVTLLGADGEVLMEADGPGGGSGQEVIAATLDQGGELSLLVRAKDDALTGRFTLWLGELRARREGDELRAVAELQYGKATQFQAIESAASRLQAIQLLQDTNKTWKALGDVAAEAATLDEIAEAYRLLGRLDEALESAQQSVELWTVIGDNRGFGVALNNLGLVLRRRGDFSQALQVYEQALDLARFEENEVAEARILTNMGFLFRFMGDLPGAERALRRGLELSAGATYPTQKAARIGELGWLQAQLGQVDEALESYGEALGLLEGRSEIAQRAGILGHRAATELGLGQNQRALDDYQEQLVLMRSIGNLTGVSAALSKLGQVLAELGRFDEALYRLREAEAVSVGAGDRLGEISALIGLGRVLGSLDRHDESVELLTRANQIAKSTGSRYWEAVTLEGLGAELLSGNRIESSIEVLTRSLDLWRAMGIPGHQAETLRWLGAAWREGDEAAKARTSLVEGLELSRSMGARSVEAETLFETARLERQVGRLDLARALASEGLDVIESLRIDVVSDELRSSFLASRSYGYELLITVLMELAEANPAGGFALEALFVSERSRARSLLDLLAESSGGVNKGSDEDLLAREQSLRRAISAEQLRMRRQESFATPDAGTLPDLLDEYRDIEEEIRRANPRFASLVAPSRVDLDALVVVLGQDTALVEYYLGASSGYLWVVTADELRSFRLPGRDELGPKVSEAYRALTERNRPVDGESHLQRDERWEAADAEYREVSRDLSRWLVQPFLQDLQIRRWIVVADGPLHYLPFAALPDPRVESEWKPLVLDVEIVMIPSAAVLLQVTATETPHAHPKKLAVLADPVFGQNDPRILSRVTDGAESRGVGPPSLEGFQRLRFSRSEAQELVSLVGEEQSLLALDFEASRDLATSPELAKYEWLHFATHGVVDADNPGLSGLVFSLVDEDGRSQDGFLRLFDIYHLDLSAELVVLSGCRTALGQELRGEGIVGLTRGFLYAGVPRVVASVWDVQDKATRELMERFYRSMVEDGLSPAASLRQAQIQLWGDSAWHSPYYWAPFVFQGLWQ